MLDRVAVVGDVHGMIDPLRSATKWLSVHWDGPIVFVGDYINRGPDSYQVLEELLDLKRKWGPRLTLLLGNHELALLEFLHAGRQSLFLSHGGLDTVASYLRSRDIPIQDYPLTQFVESFPDSHLELLRSMAVCYETQDLLVTHSGFSPLAPESRRPDDVTLGRHPDLFGMPASTPRRLVVFGHYVQHDGAPYISDRLICIDTGCGTRPGAPLSVLTLPDRRFLTFGGTDD